MVLLDFPSMLEILTSEQEQQKIRDEHLSKVQVKHTSKTRRLFKKIFKK